MVYAKITDLSKQYMFYDYVNNKRKFIKKEMQMNVRLEAINLLKKLHRRLKFNYTDSELKEISEFLASKITKEEKLNQRVKKLLLAIKERDQEIANLKRIIRESTPKTKAKDVLTYNYIEMQTINEALEMLIGECEYTLKHDKSICISPLIHKKNLAEIIINRNKEKMKGENN